MDDDQGVNLGPNSNSPIFRVHEDILWRIFSLNADMRGFEASANREEGSEDFHPLNIARYSSQVCHQWRKTIIESSSIWAGLIDLDLLNKHGDENWMDEVMRRTGQSLLSVIARGKKEYHSTLQRFFTSLLTRHWSRIRKFNVTLNTSQFDRALWVVLWGTPSPHLEEFRLERIPGTHPLLLEPRDDALFSDHAPVLRVFHCTNIGFHYRASWMSTQLRSLAISSPLTPPEALVILSQTSNVEELIIETAHSNDPLPRGRPPIYLPRLRELRITDMLRPCVAFLEAITPAAICELRLWITRPWFIIPGSESEAYAKALVPLLSRFLENYFNAQEVTECSVTTGHGWFRFSRLCIERAEGYLPFTTTILTHFTLPVGHIFPSTRLKTITVLEFLQRVPTENLDDEDPTLDTFLLSLTFVKTLKLSQWAAARINELSVEHGLMFPSLQRVELRYIRRHRLVTENQLALVSFLTNRKHAGNPIAVLDIAEWPNYRWDFLEEVEGLKVVWNVDGMNKEYICGSGHPERLDLAVT